MLVERIWDSPSKLVVIKIPSFKNDPMRMHVFFFFFGFEQSNTKDLQECQLRNMRNGKRNVSNKLVVRQVPTR